MEEENQNLNIENTEISEDSLIRVSGMYKDWFLDYASYVILERAVPSIEDGFKPVQRRILHSMKDLDDGRFNKGSASYDPGYVSTGEGGIRSSCIHDFVIGGISRSCS